MKATSFLDASARLPVAPFADIFGDGGLVVVAPHPDDESLGCGGAIAQAVREGRAVRIVVVSDGVGSHPNSRAYPPERLRALRESETRDAVHALGLDPAHVSFLRLPDRHVPTLGPDAENAIVTIAAVAASIQASAVAVAWRHDPHCDHAAAFLLAQAACRRLANVRLLEFSVWGHALSADTDLPDAPRGLRLDIASDLQRKRDAIASHRSQVSALIDDDPDGFRLTADDRARFEGASETFLFAAP